MSAKPAEPTETVLVVDDNLQNREVAEGHLVAAGYNAVLAESGPAAITLFQQKRPDLVLLDVLMPGMDGFTTCRRLRALPDGSRTPILFLTALGDLGTHKAALDSGADDFLTKPINRTELVIRIRSLLRIKQLSEQLQQNFEVIRTQRDALLEAHRQKEELAALIVHDLKNPLSSILSNVQFLSRSNQLAPLDKDSLLDVLRASESMLRMVMNLLDISRSEDGALVANLAQFDLPALMEEICSEMGRRVDDKNQKLVLKIDAGVERLHADRDLVRRIVENLIDNAYKYGPRNATINIEVRVLDPAGGAPASGVGPSGVAPAMEIRVRDQGEGVPESYRTRIFEKYARLEHRDGAELRNSHGLGLVFCRRAVDVHGGQIWVEDSPPRGSCFCVQLPLAQAAAVSDEAPIPARAAGAGA
ncbi:MAG TPA: response regulator [Polyangia bacterium]|jgi:signal transduction histidine kinase|nr:response regulator [Polyangia bacterium]